MIRVLPLLLFPSLLFADTAVRDGGMEISGRLGLSKTGQLHFTPDAGRTPDDIVEYRMNTSAPLFRAAPGMQLTLAGGEKLTGVLLGMEKDKLAFRTAWSDRFDIPRDAIISLTHLPGRRTVFHEDFADKLTAWTVKGTLSPESSSVALKKVGDSLTCKLARPIAEGRIAVNFLDAQQAKGARWLVEATFTHKDGQRTVRVTLAGSSDRIETDIGIKGTAREVSRTKTLRRLFIDFSRGSLRLFVDDEILWFTLDEGPGGSLAQVRLVCVDLPRAEPTGAVAFSAFAIEQAVAEQPHPPGDTAQDELWLADGDQLFGQVIRADARAVEIKGRFGTRRYAWTELRGWFARQTRKATPVKGAAVHVGLHGGLRREKDVLIGTLSALDAKHVKLKHPILGELALPRERVAWLRPSPKTSR